MRLWLSTFVSFGMCETLIMQISHWPTQCLPLPTHSQVPQLHGVRQSVIIHALKVCILLNRKNSAEICKLRGSRAQSIALFQARYSNRSSVVGNVVIAHTVMKKANSSNITSSPTTLCVSFIMTHRGKKQSSSRHFHSDVQWSSVVFSVEPSNWLHY